MRDSITKQDLFNQIYARSRSSRKDLSRDIFLSFRYLVHPGSTCVECHGREDRIDATVGKRGLGIVPVITSSSPLKRASAASGWINLAGVFRARHGKIQCNLPVTTNEALLYKCNKDCAISNRSVKGTPAISLSWVVYIRLFSISFAYPSRSREHLNCSVPKSTSTTHTWGSLCEDSSKPKVRHPLR